MNSLLQLKQQLPFPYHIGVALHKWKHNCASRSVLAGCKPAVVMAAATTAVLPARDKTQERVLLFQHNQLLQGMLHKRYKRFLADVQFPDSSSDQQQASTASKGTAATAVSGAAAAATGAASSRKRRRRTAAAAAAAGAAAAAEEASAPTPAALTAAAAASSSDALQAVASVLTLVHCPNTGSMAGMLDSLPAPAACSVSDSATRKYKHTLEMICVPTQQPVVQTEGALSAAAAAAEASQQCGTWVGVHSALANKLAAAMLKQQLLPQLGQYSSVQPEVKLGGSSSTRFDFLLTRPDGRKVYLEVKSVTMAMTLEQWSSSRSSSSAAVSSSSNNSRKRAADGSKKAQERRQAAAAAVAVEHQAAEAAAAAAAQEAASAAAAAAVEGGSIAVFPDAVSVRAQRHVQDLTQLKAAGHDAVCLFVLQRDDCCCFAPAAHIDPAYAEAVRAAHAAGVQMLAVVCEQDPASGAIWFRGCVPVML